MVMIVTSRLHYQSLKNADNYFKAPADFVCGGSDSISTWSLHVFAF
jgi:hypothetical protein